MKKGIALLLSFIVAACFGMSVNAYEVNLDQPEEIVLETFEFSDNGENYICIISEVIDDGNQVGTQGVEPLTKTSRTFNITYTYSDGSYLGKLKVSLTGYYSASYNTSYISSVSTSYTGDDSELSFSSSKSGNHATVVRTGMGKTITYTFTLSTSGVWSYTTSY